MEILAQVFEMALVLDYEVVGLDMVVKHLDFLEVLVLLLVLVVLHA
jgi:hypothetical protein